MEYYRVDHEIVTKFLLSTCRIRHGLNRETVMALGTCANIATQGSINDDDYGFIPILTGSVAEFYIEPMLSCVSDADVMIRNSGELAIPAGTAPPTQLPGEFHSLVLVYEIVDSEFPGYVYTVPDVVLHTDRMYC